MLSCRFQCIALHFDEQASVGVQQDEHTMTIHSVYIEHDLHLAVQSNVSHFCHCILVPNHSLGMSTCLTVITLGQEGRSRR